jgi:hypothetical protein
MKHYLKTIPFELAKKLKGVGFPQKPGLNYYQISEGMPGAGYVGNPENYDYEQFWNYKDVLYTAPTYAEVLDWLLDKGLSVEIKCRCPIELGRKSCWFGTVYKISNAGMLYGADKDKSDWCDACDLAIEFAITVVNNYNQD